MSTQITRLDNEVRVHFGSTPLAPGYQAEVDGETFPMYLATKPSTAPALQFIPKDATHLVAFLADDDIPSWSWADQGGATTRDAAEALLVELADGRPGKGFAIAAPSKDVTQR